MLLASCVISSCNGRKVYDKYVHTPIAGWEKNDMLTFDIPRVKTKGTYSTDIGLRIFNSYPFTGVTLVIERRVFPSAISRKDTLRCTLTDNAGQRIGNGVNYYQYAFGLPDIKLKEGDSLHITVRHDMKREILPGISDVGISLRMR